MEEKARSQVNIESQYISQVLAANLGRLGETKREVAELLFKKGLASDGLQKQLEEKIAQLELSNSELVAKAKLAGIDLSKPFTEGMQAKVQDELGVIELRKSAEELVELKQKYDEQQKKLKRLKKKYKKASGNRINKLLDRAIDDPTGVGEMLGSLKELLKGEENQPRQLAGMDSERMQQAARLYNFFSNSFKGDAEQSMMMDVMIYLAKNKVALNDLHSQLNQNQNETAA